MITAGHGTNDVLSRLDGCDLQIPITKDRPSEAKYFVPPADRRSEYTSDVMPVIAYLDTGVYVHPIVEGVDRRGEGRLLQPAGHPTRSHRCPRHRRLRRTVHARDCKSATSTDVLDVDQCDYDLVADDDFVLGPVPDSHRASTSASVGAAPVTSSRR